MGCVAHLIPGVCGPLLPMTPRSPFYASPLWDLERNKTKNIPHICDFVATNEPPLIGLVRQLVPHHLLAAMRENGCRMCRRKARDQSLGIWRPLFQGACAVDWGYGCTILYSSLDECATPCLSLMTACFTTWTRFAKTSLQLQKDSKTTKIASTRLSMSPTSTHQ